MDRKQLIQNCIAEISISHAKAQYIAISNIMKARQIQEFAKLEKQERLLTFEIGKLKANNQITTEQENALKLVKEKMQQVLLNNKIKPSSLAPNYSCKQCGDTGYINGSFCVCLQNKLREKIMKDCGIAKRNLVSFAEFNPNISAIEKQNIYLQRLKMKLESIANSFPSIDYNFIIISGQVGVGKTFLSECLATSLINRGFITSFITAFDFNNILLTYHTCFDEQKQSYFNALIDPDVLILDDLGTEPLLKNVTLEYLYIILNERSRLGRLTVITTNLNIEGILKRYKERIFSRLLNKHESLAVYIDGEDLRLNKNAKRSIKQ